MADFRNVFILANRNPKKPKPHLPVLRIPRPGDNVEQDRKRPATSEELARFLSSRGLVRYKPKPIEEV